ERSERLLVPARRLLRGAGPGFLRLQQRRHRRHPRHHRAARSHSVARRRLPLAAAVLPVPAARRRLRHQRLLFDPSRVRRPGRCGRAGRGVSPPGPADHRRPGHEPHERRPPVVPGVAPGPHQSQGRLVRVERRRHPLSRRPHHLRRHRAVELVVGPRARAVLLAPVLQPPARPELRQPRGPARHARRREVLARRRPRRLPSRRGAVSVRARRQQRREPHRDARLPQAAAQGDRRLASRHRHAGRGQPVAGRRRRLLRRRRRVPHVLPLPAHAPHVHGRAPGAAVSDHRDPGPDPRDPRRLPVGHLPPQPRRAHPRDGHRRRARLHVQRVRPGPSDEAQHRHRPAPRPAGRQQPGGRRAAPRPAVQPPGKPRPLLRGRNRHGRQHLPRRPRRCPHADAVDARPQRGLQQGRLRAAVPAPAHGPGVRLPGRQRRGHATRPGIVPTLDAAGPPGPPPARRRPRARNARDPLGREPLGAGVPPTGRRPHHALRQQPQPVRPTGRAPAGPPLGQGARRAVRAGAIPGDRRAAVSVDPRWARVLLVRARRRSGGAAV
ncbi:MAG: GH13_16 / GH13_36 / GH13_23 / GH13_17 / GH13_ 40 / GH13 / GH13_4 / GH13_31 / GH13_35 / GH13_29 / G H13_30 / GH13_20 / GH13_2 / GH13_34 / GH13_21 / GH13 _18 / GH13_1 / GH13_10 / GH13_37, partial [uncultured Acidimicrobiales bacterium]